MKVFKGTWDSRTYVEAVPVDALQQVGPAYSLWASCNQGSSEIIQ